eukprot:GEZU01013793.1.p1 GENE.GEZU01013793.1~~GEZU01013793.1.p1  ORF type:complete len:203 (+),score=9.52 GEZU01013793.1:58-666(+)
MDQMLAPLSLPSVRCSQYSSSSLPSSASSLFSTIAPSSSSSSAPSASGSADALLSSSSTSESYNAVLSQSNGLPIAAIVGIVVGLILLCAVVLILLVALAVMVRKRYKGRHSSSANSAVELTDAKDLEDKSIAVTATINIDLSKLQINDKRLTIEQNIGSGQYGIVHTCTYSLQRQVGAANGGHQEVQGRLDSHNGRQAALP